MAGDEKIRLQFDVSQEGLKQIDELKLKSGASTRAELFKKVIKLNAFILQKQQEGYELVLVKGDEKTIVKFI
jgi:hypothetical protein